VTCARRSGELVRLDSIIPRYQFHEIHSRQIDATPERVFDAARKVTAGEIRFFRTLTAIRRGWQKTPESILNASASEPLLDVATRSGFEWLANDPPRELVVGSHITRDVFAVMNFLITPEANGATTIRTETRVYAATTRARVRFALYWMVIRAGSGLIRRMWLRAIDKRARRIMASVP